LSKYSQISFADGRVHEHPLDSLLQFELLLELVFRVFNITRDDGIPLHHHKPVFLQLEALSRRDLAPIGSQLSSGDDVAVGSHQAEGFS
jgi:hypothetical protein